MHLLKEMERGTNIKNININIDTAFEAYKILTSTKTVDVIPAFYDFFVESCVDVNIYPI
jgi:hypothetical protein